MHFHEPFARLYLMTELDAREKFSYDEINGIRMTDTGLTWLQNGNFSLHLPSGARKDGHIHRRLRVTIGHLLDQCTLITSGCWERRMNPRVEFHRLADVPVDESESTNLSSGMLFTDLFT